jgi:Tol biopolymer transport system component
MVAMTVGLLAVSGGDALAKKGGGGKPGGGGGDPGNTTPPDIVFLADNDELHLLQDDGTGETYLATARGARAAWSPDGTQVAYWGESDGYGIYIADVAGGTSQKVVSIDHAASRYVAWSPVPAPDGHHKLAFTMKRREADGTLSAYVDIFIANLDGTGLENVSRSWGIDSTPSWSPSGGQLSFSYGSTLWVVDIEHRAADGSPTWHEIFDDPDMPAHHPEWSKTGNALVFTARDTTEERPLNDVFVMGLSYVEPSDGSAAYWTGSTPVNVSNTSESEEHMPCWSSDDSKIACRSVRFVKKGKSGSYTGYPSLDVITLSGGSRQTLLDGDCDFPVWRPSSP